MKHARGVTIPPLTSGVYVFAALQFSILSKSPTRSLAQGSNFKSDTCPNIQRDSQSSAAHFCTRTRTLAPALSQS
ncbi:hypothetical protein CROQUDRAFT_100234 [Cronartium quercuum f. sp. fusiforme G11]|uniref:Uncharacterized protein n=1 Tax=Cronartium quercuum f. sp. fusiforme G11 TaxID=708437 RepID=A0A9P6NAD3_9BASI|nr:hypothetical protein CROQUDRAFT_100234 [Cronartium quercuum f. sp. fusiforme G11]